MPGTELRYAATRSICESARFSRIRGNVPASGLRARYAMSDDEHARAALGGPLSQFKTQLCWYCEEGLIMRVCVPGLLYMAIPLSFMVTTQTVWGKVPTLKEAVLKFRRRC
eukprot:3292549-Rhodomonas_salina.3